MLDFGLGTELNTLFTSIIFWAYSSISLWIFLFRKKRHKTIKRILITYTLVMLPQIAIIVYEFNFTLLYPSLWLLLPSLIVPIASSTYWIVLKYYTYRNPLDIGNIFFIEPKRKDEKIIFDKDTFNTKCLERFISNSIFELHNKLNSSVVIYGIWIEIFPFKITAIDYREFPQDNTKIPIETIELPSIISPKDCVFLEINLNWLYSIFSLCDDISKNNGKNLTLRIGVKHQYGKSYSASFNINDLFPFQSQIKHEYSIKMTRKIINEAIENKEHPDIVFQKKKELDESLFPLMGNFSILSDLYLFLEKDYPDNEYTKYFKPKYEYERDILMNSIKKALKEDKKEGKNG